MFAVNMRQVHPGATRCNIGRASHRGRVMQAGAHVTVGAWVGFLGWLCKVMQRYAVTALSLYATCVYCLVSSGIRSPNPSESHISQPSNG